MKNNYDFKAALDDMSDRADWVEENWETIQFALEFTHRALNGEVSDEVLDLFHNTIRIEAIPRKQEANVLNDAEVIKAMAAKLAKECEASLTERSDEEVEDV